MSYFTPTSATPSASAVDVPMAQVEDNMSDVKSEASTASVATSVTLEDLRTMAIPELARLVNPALMSDLKNVAPGVLNGLIAQHCAMANAANSQQPPPLGVAPPLGVSQSGQMRRSTREEDSSANNSDYTSAVGSLKRVSPNGPTSKTEQRKLLRATRNRQSAASSRERKKRHLQELQRRFDLLTSENIRLEQSEIDSVRDRFSKEDQLIEEGKKLERQLNFKVKKIGQLEKKEEDMDKGEKPAKLPSVEKKLEKPKTWDNGALGAALRSYPF